MGFGSPSEDPQALVSYLYVQTYNFLYKISIEKSITAKLLMWGSLGLAPHTYNVKSYRCAIMACTDMVTLTGIRSALKNPIAFLFG